MEAVREARELVLNKYQPLAGASHIIRELPPSELLELEIKPVKHNLVYRVLQSFHKLINIRR